VVSREDAIANFEEAARILEPVHWRHVYIRSIGTVGYVSASRQNGKPSEATITVTLMENGRWRHSDPSDTLSVNYTMDEARRDLVPNVECLIKEEPV
jgi:hypothetical protein